MLYLFLVVFYLVDDRWCMLTVSQFNHRVVSLTQMPVARTSYEHVTTSSFDNEVWAVDTPSTVFDVAATSDNSVCVPSSQVSCTGYNYKSDVQQCELFSEVTTNVTCGDPACGYFVVSLLTVGCSWRDMTGTIVTSVTPSVIAIQWAAIY